MKYTTVFLDTETTGNKPTDRLCQICYIEYRPTERFIFESLYRPPLPISVDAMAVHHITNRMVANLSSFHDAPEYSTIQTLLESNSTVLIAHNALFDITMLAHEGISVARYIDTLKVIRSLDPEMEMERHSLQYLRYYLDLNEELSEKVHAHDAFGDVLVLELLYKYLTRKLHEMHGMNEDEAVEHMIAESLKPAFMAKVKFGKHNGRKTRDIAKTDPDYLKWLLDQKRVSADNGENEADWIYTLETALSEVGFRY